jgi:hypothetical protein
MVDLSREIDDLQLDIQTLNTLIHLAFQKGVSDDDFMLRACANVLHERRTRLEELERARARSGEETAEE